MGRITSGWRRLAADWPRWAQVAGMLLGTEQVIAWWGFGHEPNLGAMTFAGACLMFQRVEARLRRKEEN